MKYLILFLFPVVAFANYMSINQVGLGESTVYPNYKKCVLYEKVNCVAIPKDYNYRFYKMVDGNLTKDTTLESTYINDTNNKKTLKLESDSALIRLKSLDVGTIQDAVLKDIVIYLQGRG